MARPQYWLNPFRNFPTEVDEAAKHVSEIRREFLTTGLLNPNSVRATIRESWQRCIQSVEPDRAEVPITFTRDVDLQDLLEAHEIFIQAANPVITRLTNLLSGSGYIIGLADPEGRLLRVNGDQVPYSWLEHIGLIPGSNWSEPSAGTNGIGTALAVGHAVQVIGPEHFCDGWRDITCITVPIRHPWYDETAGVLDISGDYHLVRPFFTGILAAAALEIKQNLSNLLGSHMDHKKPFQIVMSTISKRGFYGAVGNPKSQSNRAGYKVLPEFNDIQARLEYQERRAFIAERLALAVGAVSASLDTQTTLERVAEQAAHLFGLDSAAACILDDAGELIGRQIYSKSITQTARTLQALNTILSQTSVIELLREGGEPVTVDNASVNPPWAKLSIDQSGVSSFALIPLQYTQNFIGFILAPRPTPYQWRADDLRLAITFAIHAASALENSRMFDMLQQHQRHIEELNAVNQLLQTLFDPAQHLDLIIESIVTIMNFDAGLILLQKKPGADPILAAHYGLPTSSLTDLSEISRRYLCEIIKDDKLSVRSIMSCKLKPDDELAFIRLQDTGVCDLMVAGMIAGNEVLGCIMVAHRQHQKLTKENLTLFTNIGQELGLALKNAQLLRSVSEMDAIRKADRIKSRFLMTVSHDLRSPLTAIRTSVESLLDQDGTQTSADQTNLLGNIAGQSKRLTHMVDQLLDLSRIDAGALALDRDWTELGALITDTVTKFEHLNSPHEVKLRLAKDLPLLYLDPERLVQVLWNLLENAHKYSPPHTPIKIESLLTLDKILIRVTDRGPGIPVDEREKIFQYFYRLDRDQRTHTPGSGLGLAICRGIMEAHGGSIFVEDEPGGGSCFCVTLPLPSTYPDSLKALEDHEPAGFAEILAHQD
jgi:two-component system sensor histidine kinase KdpD